uniref:Uncharacterized protein n=1 Tax=Nelumbo nucifera TaxID=4432 RepID=A0A822YS60_NELNU|nr:TPA_asm: hypothetical protein HUJ06_006132 [Nelumbo nucifera]
MGNVTDSVAARFTFFPPDPPTYDVRREENGRLLLSGLSGEKFRSFFLGNSFERHVYSIDGVHRASFAPLRPSCPQSL